MLKAVIFDFDGTLVDSEYLHCVALAKSIKENTGITIKPAQVGLLAGMTYAEKTKRLLQDKVANYDISKITSDAYDYFLSVALDKIKLRTGAKRVIKMIHSLNIKIGLYSPNNKEFLRKTLQKFDLLKYFQVIVGREDVQRPKPDPEGYLLAAKLLDVKPEECIVFEDTPTGFQSATSAGMRTIVLYNPYLKNPSYPSVFKEIKSYKEITKEFILSL
ncbi:MAG: HAD family phosphatase [Candidatus Aenigmarchaeota archaeon]|nr:HAD family phosphatase [Candidatus Aenigmarchaeota archaeon]